MVLDDSDARDCSLRARAQGLPKVTACGLLHTWRVSVRAMQDAFRTTTLGTALVLASTMPVQATEPPLPRERHTLEAIDAQPVQRAALTLAGAADDAESPNLLGLPLQGRSGARLSLAGGSAEGLRWQLGASVQLQRSQGADLEGSGLSLPLGPGRAYASVERRHWGPSPFGSLILDGSARALPAIGWRKTSAQPFAWRGLSWLGPWRTDAFASQLHNDTGPGGVKLLGWRLEIEPLRGLVLGGSRVLQWGGEGRSQTFGSLLRGIAGFDNFESPDRSAEPGNQLAGFDARWTLPWGGPWRFSLHGQAIGEDEAGHLPSVYLASGGGELATTMADGTALRLFGELADTMAGRAFSAAKPGAAYRHPLYPAGYTQRNDPLAHPAGGDVRLASAGLALQRGPLRMTAMAHRGDARRRGLGGELRMASDRGVAIGLAASEWRDAAGRDRSLQLRIELPLNELR